MAVGTASALVATAAPARAQEVGFSIAVSAARDSHPDHPVSGVFLFNSLDVTRGPVRVWASIPLIRQTGTFSTTGEDVEGTLPIDQTNTGIGDPLIRVDVQLHNNPAAGLQVGVAGAVKPSLVDPANGLGTGAADFAVGGSVFKAVGRTSLLVDVLFWKYGDPDDVDFQDTIAYSVGVGRVIGRGGWSSIVSVSGFSTGVEGASPPLQLNVAALALTKGGQSVAISASIGLNDSASDFAIGTSWRATF